MKQIKAAVIIVAAGASRRFKSKTPKQFQPLCGKPVFLWSVETFRKISLFKQVIVVLPKQKIGSFKKFQLKYGFDAAVGGKERFDSVRTGLSALNSDINIVAIHDGARPLVAQSVIIECVLKASSDGAAIAASRATDTIKISNSAFKIKQTIPRDTVWFAQTPQVFKRSIIEKAYKKLKTAVTDDAQVVELAGGRVSLVESASDNIKITQKKDLKFAENYLRGK